MMNILTFDIEEWFHLLDNESTNVKLLIKKINIMATKKELGDNLEKQVDSFLNFKIGKTGQTIEERYEQEYKNYYNHYKIIGSSPNKQTIDEFEKYLIERFYEYLNCDNEQVGGGDMADSDKYLVYVVYNIK